MPHRPRPISVMELGSGTNPGEVENVPDAAKVYGPPAGKAVPAVTGPTWKLFGLVDEKLNDASKKVCPAKFSPGIPDAKVRTVGWVTEVLALRPPQPPPTEQVRTAPVLGLTVENVPESRSTPFKAPSRALPVN